ncbi:MAG: CoA-disulfide reductase, partial [Spirochaetales bacterium]|nr:CoA-disulfide reductase [Spirochaetales bacterium]
KLLGAQVSGEAGVDRRLDVLSTAIFSGLTVGDLSELDLAYAPPFGSANDPVNIAGFAAENRISGYSPLITAAELENAIADKKVLFLDIRDVFTFRKAHVEGSINIAAEQVLSQLASLEKDVPVIVCDDTGKVAHRVVRSLMLDGFKDVTFIGGGYQSLERYERALGYQMLQVGLSPLEAKSLEEESVAYEAENENGSATIEEAGKIVVDVRTPEEYRMGAYPGAVNIPLDELTSRIEELGDKNREIILYCASGARSAYAVRFLVNEGFSNITNGGGIMQMMSGSL